MSYQTPAQKQFHTSSIYPYPEGYTPFKIRNDYPLVAEVDHYPWLQFDPTKQSKAYLNAVKEYVFKGMIDNEFDPWKNKERNWYHAPWMHYGPAGREPLHGLTTERFVPPREFSAKQQRWTQNWALALYNSEGASVFGKMWGTKGDQSGVPTWDKSHPVRFPFNTVMCKLIWTNATTHELDILKDAPSWSSMIAVQPTDPTQMPDQGDRVKNAPSEVRLLQLDVAVKDPQARETGWVWGTFMYVGNVEPSGPGPSGGYYNLIPVGLSWGNDPSFNQQAYEDWKAKPDHDETQGLQEVWIDKEADNIRKGLDGVRPFWGWNGRLNGPIDHFISSCQSCHSTSQWIPAREVQGTTQVPPLPLRTADGESFLPVNDAVTMTWFQNIGCGDPITKGALAADYSFQLMIGHERYLMWRDGKEWDSQHRQGPMMPMAI